MPDLVQVRFDGGLNLSRPPGLIKDGECFQISNFRYHQTSLLRRDGIDHAYLDTEATAVSMLKRFYRIRTSGSITKFFFRGSGTKLHKADSDWDDDSPSAAIDWTNITLPQNTGNNTLRKNLGGPTQVAIGSGLLTEAAQSQSWCYLGVQYGAGDDENEWDLNVPMRTDGTKIYLHGLTPPEAPTTLVEVAGSALTNGKTYRYRSTILYDEGRLGESALGDTLTHAVVSGIPVDATFSLVEPTDDASAVSGSRIRTYRQLGDAAVGDPYFLIDEYTITGAEGWPVLLRPDTTTDVDLPNGRLADVDIYMPSKYRRLTMWKERCVIGNLKNRHYDTSLTPDIWDPNELDNEGGGVHKGRLRFSEPFNPDRFRRNTWMDPGADTEAGELKQVIVNPLIDALFAYYETTVYAITGDSPLGEAGEPFRARNIAMAEGTPSPNSVVFHKGDLFSWTKTGIEVIRGFTARNITSKSIAPLWDFRDQDHISFADRINRSAFDQVYGIVNPITEEVIWQYPAGTSTVANKTLVLDLKAWRERGSREGIFTMWDGLQTGVMEIWRGEGDRAEIFGGESTAANGNGVYRLDFGDEDELLTARVAAKTAILATVRLAITDYGAPNIDKMFKRCRIQGKSGEVDTTITVDVNDGGLVHDLVTVRFSEVQNLWGTSTWGVGNWNVPVPKSYDLNLPIEAIGARLGFRFSAQDVLDSTSEGPTGLEIYDISVELAPLRKRTRAA